MWYENSNLPPGCSVWDLPGNRPIDAYMDLAYDTLEKRWVEEGMPECEKCETNHNLECHKSERFYENRCWVLDNMAEMLAREMMERE